MNHISNNYLDNDYIPHPFRPQIYILEISFLVIFQGNEWNGYSQTKSLHMYKECLLALQGGLGGVNLFPPLISPFSSFV